MENQALSKVDKITKAFECIKSGVIAIVSIISLLLIGALLVATFSWNSTLLEPIKVPSILEEAGYTPEVVTKRVLDEIAYINVTSTKHNKRFSARQPGDELLKLDSMPVAGSLDVKSIKSFIQDIFGIRHETMTGEITVIKEGGKTIYGVKIRQMPEDRILVDLNVDMPIKDLIQLIALNIVESKDPAVAATYLRTHNQDQRALKMIDKVLQDSDTSDDAYALTSRAHIYMRQNKLKLAQEDLAAALKLDPKFPSAMALQIQLYVSQKKFSNALELAKKEAEYYPERWQTHINLGDSYAGLGDKEKTQSSYLKAISLHPSSPIIYIKVADYFNNIGKIADADTVLHLGTTSFPNDSATFVMYADILTKEDKLEEANEALLKAYELNHELTKIQIKGGKNTMLDRQALLSKSAEFKKSHADFFSRPMEDALDNDFDQVAH